MAWRVIRRRPWSRHFWPDRGEALRLAAPRVLGPRDAHSWAAPPRPPAPSPLPRADSRLGKSPGSPAWASLQPQGAPGSTGSVPVLIVGAGPVGLTLSFLLSSLGVRSLVVERAHRLTQHPQAHVINTRTMEVLRHMSGLHEDVLRLQPPREQWRCFVYCTQLLGGTLMAAADHFAHGPHGPTGGAQAKHASSSGAHPQPLSPTSIGHFPQHRLLPLLLQRAQEAGASLQAPPAQSPGSLRPQQQAPVGPQEEHQDPVLFGWACSGFQEHAHGVTVSLTPSGPDPASAPGHKQPREHAPQGSPAPQAEAPQPLGPSHAGTGPRQVECQYLVACDGAGSGIRRALGIPLQGPAKLQQLVSVHFRCPGLGQRLLQEGRSGMLYFVFNPGVIAVIVAHSLEAGEFVAQVPFFPPAQKPEDFTPQECERLLRAAIGEAHAVPGGHPPPLPLEVVTIRAWTMSAQVAASFLSRPPAPAQGQGPGAAGAAAPSPGPGRGATGRVILSGDSAHRFPPSGGFGMNTGIQDAHNLAWKMAAVLQGLAPAALLHSYDTERRQVAQANRDLSVRNFHSAMGLAAELGLPPSAPQLLEQALEQGPLPLLLPESVRAWAMSTALQAGRAQLSPWLLSPALPLGAARLAAARQYLLQGRGLRMLFPAHDLGFRYGQEAAAPVQDPRGEASGAWALGRAWGEQAQAAPAQSAEAAWEERALQLLVQGRAVGGGRLPHHPLRQVWASPGLQDAEVLPGPLSSLDLVAPVSASCTLVVAVPEAADAPGTGSLQEWAQEAQRALQATGAPLRLAAVLSHPDHIHRLNLALEGAWVQGPGEAPQPRSSATLSRPRWVPWYPIPAAAHGTSTWEAPGESSGHASPAPGPAGWGDCDAPLLVAAVWDQAGSAGSPGSWWSRLGVHESGAVLVRPDGHVAAVLPNRTHRSTLTRRVLEVYAIPGETKSSS